MLGLALRSVAARKWRALSTAVAIFLGVAMVSGTLMLTDSVNRSFDEIFSSATEGVDVTGRPPQVVEAEFGGETGRGLDEALLARVLAVPGVAQAQGVMGDQSIAILDEDGDKIGPAGGGPPHIATSPEREPFDSFPIVDGRRARTASEVTIDTSTAAEEDYELGQRVRIAGPAGARRYEIVGFGEFGNGTSLGGASLAQFTLAEAQRLTDKPGRFDTIDVAAGDGVSPGVLARRVDRALPADVRVRTGAQTAADDADDVQEGFSFITIALLAFGGIAVFVGGFLIFNTFSIIVAQRTREFAMLRTLGASARQVLGAVLVEALVVGLVASLAGLAGGFGFVEGIKALFKAIGFDLPTSGLRLQVETVLIAFAVGVGATLVAALVPARRATRVAPLEALRQGAGAQTDAPAHRRRRSLIAVALTGLGLVLLAVGLLATDEIGAALLRMGLGLVCVFIALAMLGDRFVPPVASAIGWPIERTRGVTGRLARENARREPGRTAITAAALMIGVTLVVFVGVFTDSIKASVDDQLDQQFAGDIAVLSKDGFSPVSSRIAGSLGAVPGVDAVAAVATAPAKVRGVRGDLVVNGIDPRGVSRIADLDWRSGSDALLSRLGATGAIVESQWAQDEGIAVGDSLLVTGPEGDRVRVRVLGSARDQAGLFVSTVTMDRRVLRDRFAVRDDQYVFAGFASGVSADAVRSRVDAVLDRRFPNAEARSQSELKADQREQIDQLVALIYVLLGLSVLASAFGIVNTLSLTIIERTRELGMLRAIGTSRRQVRRMIRYESVITALLGAIAGAVIGTALAVAAVTALEDEGLILRVSAQVPVTVLLLAIALGVVAARRPAKRASRLDVIDALAHE